MWPSTVQRASLPVRFSISSASICPTPDPGQPHVPERVQLAGPADHRRRRLRLRLGALGDHHDRARTGSGTGAPPTRRPVSMSNGFSGIRMTLAPPAMPGVQRDPAGVAAHHLDDQRPVMALGRGVQPVDGLHRDVHRGVEAERVVGRAQVVVDGLRHADHGRRRLSCSLAATPRVSSPPIATSASTPRLSRFSWIRSMPELAADRRRLGQRVGPGRAEDRAAARQDAADRLRRPATIMSPSSGPRHPSRKPMNSISCSATPVRTTARITAFRPGQSPPPVRTPTRISFSSRV